MHVACIPLFGLAWPSSPPHHENLGTYCDCGTFLFTELLLCPGPGTYPILNELPTSLGGPFNYPIRSRAHREAKVMSVSQSNKRLSCGPAAPYVASAHVLSPSSRPFVSTDKIQCPSYFRCKPSPGIPASDSGTPHHNRKRTWQGTHRN